MKFHALLKKELRLCLPWLLLIAVAFGIIGAIMIKGMVLGQQHHINQDVYRDGWNTSTPSSPIREFAPLTLFAALALGIILGVVQFFLPELFGTWAFTIHRSVKPQLIIQSKLAAAMLTFFVSLGLLWTFFYSYAAVPGRFYIPIFFKTYLEGWVYILAGLIVYAGTALSSISTAHIYTTRLLGVATAAIIIFLMLWQASITGALITAAVGAFILITRIFDTFLTREF